MGPLDLEGIAGQRCRVEFGFSAEGYHALSSALTDLSQGLQNAIEAAGRALRQILGGQEGQYGKTYSSTLTPLIQLLMATLTWT